MTPRTPDLLGKTFGQLKVMSFAGRDSKRRALWKCECLCGNEPVFPGYKLQAGRRKSCGCSRLAQLRIASIKHGNTAGGKLTPEYNSWADMIKRCTNPNSQRFKYYGGRGITVSERWLSFECFLADMGVKPSPNYSLDRFPDNNGNYEPGNCRWATREEQGRNRRSNHLVTFQGKTQCLTAWAEELNVPVNKLYKLHARRKSIEEYLEKVCQSKA